MLDLTKNKYSSQWRAENGKKDERFRMIDSIMYMWDRVDDKTIRGHVDVNKYFELESAVKKMGGSIVDKKLDKVAGKEWVKIKEPKN
jgi:hypothetical protein